MAEGGILHRYIVLVGACTASEEWQAKGFTLREQSCMMAFNGNSFLLMLMIYSQPMIVGTVAVEPFYVHARMTRSAGRAKYQAIR